MLNGIENVKIMKTVCEKVVYEGLLVSLMFLKVKKFLDFFYLFQCEKKRTLEYVRAVSPTSPMKLRCLRTIHFNQHYLVFSS